MRPKKHLGQNFLRSKKIVERIALASHPSPDTILLEVGPGKGILTEALLQTGANVIAIEKDSELVVYLKEKFKTHIATNKLLLIEGDILNISLESILPHGKCYQVIANIPYYITGEILRMFLERTKQPTSMTLLVQKEVAVRIVASDKKESILSLSVKLYGKPKIVEIVKKTMFTPIPSVDSAVLLIQDISKQILDTNNVSEKDYFNLIKKAFGQKRKQLVGNLKEYGKKEELQQFLTTHHLPLTVRAEDVPFHLWIEMLKVF